MIEEIEPKDEVVAATNELASLGYSLKEEAEKGIKKSKRHAAIGSVLSVYAGVRSVYLGSSFLANYISDQQNLSTSNLVLNGLSAITLAAASCVSAVIVKRSIDHIADAHKQVQDFEERLKDMKPYLQ